MEAKEVAKTASKSNDTAETRPISSTAISSGHPTNDTTEAWKQPSVSSMNTMKATPALPSAATIPNPSSVPKPGASEMPFPPSAALKLPSQNLQHVTKSPHTSANIKPSPAETAAAAASTTTTTKSVNSGNDRVTVDRSHKPLVPTVAAGAPQPVKTNLPSHPSLKLPSFQPVPKKIPTLPTATAAIPLDKAKMQPSGMKSGMPLHPAAPPRAVPPGGKIPTPSQLPAAGKPPSTMAPPPLPTPPLPPPPPPVVDESALIEEAIRKARAPLTDKYSPFIVPSDRTLSEARNRLRKAVEQTRKLRAAFTERVYGKYRVCLRPPPTTDQIFNRVMSDPARTHRELNDEIKQLKAEKEIEKKEAQKLNAEMAAANNSGEEGKATAAAVNAETAEQLMFISAGLSLIILPEHDVAGKIDMSGYPDRAPINPETGQRVRSISAAAAAAGEVMLDRARKGATMRVERQRRRQLQIMAGEDPEKDGGDTNYSRLSLLSNATITKPPVLLTKSMIPRSKVDPTKLAAAAAASSSPAVGPLTTSTAAAASAVPHMTPKNFKRPTPKQPASTAPVTSPMVSAKAIRARVQATMSNNTLLSLNPSAEELRTDGKCGAATMAMMERGVGGKLAQQQQQQSLFKYKHPFPNSMGARRRGDAALALPSLLSAKERRMRSPAVVEETNTASTTARANRALRDILGQYVVPGSSTSNEPVRKRRRTKISFLHGLEYPQGKEGMESLSKDTGSTIDPILTFNVLKAIGLIQPSSSDGDVANGDVLSVLDPSLTAVAEKRALGEDGGQSQSSIAKLKELRNKFASKKRTFVEAFVAPQIEPPETEKPNSEGGQEATTTTAREASTTSHQQNTYAGEETKSSESSVTVAAPQALSIRGGGQELTETDDKTVTKSEAPVEKNAKDSEATASLPALNDKDKTSEQKATKDTASTGAKAKPASDMASRGMVLMNPQAMRADQAYRRTTAAHQSAAMQHGNNAHKHPTPSSSRGVQGQQHQGSDTYHHPSAANALQLAHQLHHASASMQRHHASGDLEAYIGGLRAQTDAAANYEWSQIAALGLSPHRAAMMNFTVQGRARALLARGQQNAAAAAVAHAAATQRAIMGSAYASGVTGRFPHVSGHAAMMNSSAALMGHSGINQLAQSNPPVGVPGRKVEGTSTPTPASAEKPGNKEKRDATSRTDEKDDVPSQSSAKTEEASRKRKLSTGSAESTTAEKRRNTAKGAAAKTEMDAAASGNNINLPSASQKVPNPNVLPKPSISGNGVKKSDQKVPGRIPGVPPGCSKQSSVAATIARLENGKAPPPQSTSGMQFYVPPAPPGIPSEIASLVLASRVFEAIDAWESGEVVFDPTTIIDYLLAVGIAVPIPKALVVNPLKERISSTAMKNNSFSNIPASSREVIVALILLWLWRHHEDCFQKTFAKSGRIDVDPECKWLINAAVDRSVLALSQEIGKPGSPLSVAFTQAKSKGSSAQKAVHTGDTDRPQGKTTKVDLISASVVSRSLLAGTRVDDKMDSLLPNFHDLLQYLDECRTCALHSKSQERALLATLISRKATMSLPFSHAYASSMVRAGEAVGHGELFEVVQNEDVKVSTMIPYDVFTDESGAWEDPCRPPGNFTEGLTGDDLMRRAHARAMIQKSLKKLQDRHNIKGGAPNPGPYTDPPSAGSSSNMEGGKSQSGSGGSSTPRGWLKRRPSFSEPKVQPGTGSAQATSISLYEPKHRSSPLNWKSDAPENSPYGSFTVGKKNGGGKRRSSSHGQISSGKWPHGKDATARSVSVGSFDERKKESNDGLSRSTHEIVWTEVADVFESQNVQLPVKKKKEEEPPAPKDRTIFAPFVRRTELPCLQSESESDTEEDLSDDAVLSRHQEVLDEMKQKLSVFFEARKNTAVRKNQKRKDSSKKG